MVSPTRLLKLGLSVEEVAAWLGMTAEQVETKVREAGDQRNIPAS